MRRIHHIVGLVGIVTFVLTGQVMARHAPAMQTLKDGRRLMYISRHIYLLGASVVNLMLGLYLQMDESPWRRWLQTVGSILLVASPVLIALAFAYEPGQGLAGRSARSLVGLLMLLGGAVLHFVASAGRGRIDRPVGGL